MVLLDADDRPLTGRGTFVSDVQLPGTVEMAIVRSPLAHALIKGIEVAEDTRFAQDLEWDSLTVMDFVASVEDEFDILITMNMQAEIETVGQLVDAVGKLRDQG